MVECNSIEDNSIETSNLDNQQFRLNKINEIKKYFIAEIKEKVIATTVEIASASPRLTFSFSTGLVKKLLKTTKNKKNCLHYKIVILVRSKLNSIESKLYEALMNNQISHEDVMIIINEERNGRELKESIRMMKGQ